MPQDDFLPSFHDPPVVEVVCGVVFEPLQYLMAPHLGLLWDRLQPNYTTVTEASPLGPAIGPPESQNRPPLPRVWFLNEEGDSLIQVQRDRFLHNWRRSDANSEYPRYGTVVTQFKDNFALFQEFVNEFGLGEIEPVEYELSYFNYLYRGKTWDSLRDLGHIFRDIGWSDPDNRFLPPPDDVRYELHFELPEEQGALRMRCRNGTIAETQEEIIAVDLVAKGMPGGPTESEMQQWFDLAHSWIVQGFADVTTRAAQEEHWRRVR